MLNEIDPESPKGKRGNIVRLEGNNVPITCHHENQNSLGVIKISEV